MVEAEHWRRELRRDLKWLRKARSFRRWSERRVSRYERRLILAAAQVHVMLDHLALPAALTSQPLGCLRYREREDGSPDAVRDRAEIPRRFELEAPSPGALPAGELCRHLLHHSVLAAVSRTPRRFTHLWVVSGDPPGRMLYEIDMEGLLEFFGRFSHADVSVRRRAGGDPTAAPGGSRKRVPPSRRGSA